jgi:hypothetical protein
MNGTDDTIAAASGDINNKQTLSLLILLNQTFSKEQKQLVLHKINSSMLKAFFFVTSSDACVT